MSVYFEDLASIDDIELRVADISDNISHALVKHEFIGQDGARVDNMGRHAREVTFRALFYGLPHSNGFGLVDANYDEHFSWLIDMMDSGKNHTLIHPKYGTLVGKIQNLKIFHDESLQYVAIDVTFVEDGIGTNTILPAVQSITDIAKQNTIDALNNQIALNLALAQYSGAGDVAGVTGFDPAQSLSSQSELIGLTISSATRTYLTQCDSVINVCNTFLNNVTLPMNSIDSAVNFVDDVPSITVGAINNACNRIVASLTGLINLPNQFVQNMGSQIQALSNLISAPSSAPALRLLATGSWAPFQASVFSVGAAVLAFQAAAMLENDNAVSAALKQTESKPTWDDAGNRLSAPIISDTMSVQDLEMFLYAVRFVIQQAIDPPIADPELKANARDNQPLLNTASALRSYVDNIKLNRLSVKTLQVPNIPLLQLCNTLGLSYIAAERILKLNPTIKNPTFTSGTIQTYAQ